MENTIESIGFEDQSCMCLMRSNFTTQHVLEPARGAICVIFSSFFAESVNIQKPLDDTDRKQLHLYIYKYKITQNKS